jgi:hypothetical protein
MKKMHKIMGGILVFVLFCSVGTVAGQPDSSAGVLGTGDISEDIMPYNGTIGADSPLHGLKLAMEDLDETFTFNDTLRVEKRLDHAQIRIAEFRQVVDLNQTRAADRALEQYRQKLNLTEQSLGSFGSNATVLLHAQEMIARHQIVLAGLKSRHQDNSGLARAYDNSLLLEQKFGEKTEMRFLRVAEKNNKTVFKAVKVETTNQDRFRTDTAAPGQPSEKEKDATREKIKDLKDPAANVTNTPQTGSGKDTPAIMNKTREEKESSRIKEKNGHD